MQCPLCFVYARLGYNGLSSFPTRRSSDLQEAVAGRRHRQGQRQRGGAVRWIQRELLVDAADRAAALRQRQGRRLQFQRSEEHTSELQSPCNLVCRLLLEKKK